MTPGWVYVLELAPSGRIKVGKTTSPARRMGQHTGNAAFGGSEVVRVATFRVDDMHGAETRVLDRLKRAQHATLVHGRETFVGVSFVEVLTIVDDLVARPRLTIAANAELLGRIGAAMDAAGAKRALLGELLDMLGDAAPATTGDLGRELRRLGVDMGTVWSSVSKRTGYGVKRELVADRAAA